jgi:hypothetical protein
MVKLSMVMTQSTHQVLWDRDSVTTCVLAKSSRSMNRRLATALRLFFQWGTHCEMFQQTNLRQHLALLLENLPHKPVRFVGNSRATTLLFPTTLVPTSTEPST